MPMRRELYPPDWEAISLRIRHRDGNRCLFCGVENHKPHPITGSQVVLTTAHLDHRLDDHSDANLAALCQRCHLAYDSGLLPKVLYADPPWRFITRSVKGKGRSSEAWYDCMSLAQLQAMPVAQMGAKDSLLILWTSRCYLKIAMGLIPSWGYEYKSIAFTWVKTTKDGKGYVMSMGYGTRANPEFCLLASRGKGVPRLRCDVRELIFAPRGRPHQKPVEAYERIERLYPGPHLELFARNRRPGWYSLGNEVDTGPLQQRRWRSDSYPQAAE